MSRTTKDNKKLDGSFHGWWRFLSARRDGSGKMNTYDETNRSRDNTRLKRQASKDTRRFGKEILRKNLKEDI